MTNRHLHSMSCFCSWRNWNLLWTGSPGIIVHWDQRLVSLRHEARMVWADQSQAWIPGLDPLFIVNVIYFNVSVVSCHNYILNIQSQCRCHALLFYFLIKTTRMSILANNPCFDPKLSWINAIVPLQVGSLRAENSRLSHDTLELVQNVRSMTGIQHSLLGKNME